MAVKKAICMQSNATQDTTPSQALAHGVKQRRHDLGLSQTEAGLLSGVGRVFVSQVESGKATVRLDKLLALLNTLGLQLKLENGTAGIALEESLAGNRD